MSAPLQDELRERFRDMARVRIEEMTALVEQIEADRSDLRALAGLAIHFHGLAGMGGTFGFPRVSEIGDEAEELIFPIVKSGLTPDEATVAKFRAVVGEIAEELRS